jgi:hypothetical protein
MRIVFRTIILSDGPELVKNPLNSNVMWDVRKELPVTWTRIVTAGGTSPCRGALGSLVEGAFQYGQALLGAFAQRVVPVAGFVLPRV